MKFNRSLVRGAACLAVLGLCHAARAATFFDDTTYAVGGYDTASSAQTLSVSFVASNVATNLTAELMLRQTAAGTHTLQVYENTASGTSPYYRIGTLTGTSSPNTHAGLVSFIGTGIKMTAGKQYWLVLSSTGGLAWNYTSDATPRANWANFVPTDKTGPTPTATGNMFPYVFRVSDTLNLPTVTLKTSDTAPYYHSFAAGTNWADGKAPSFGTAYVVGSGRVLRNAVDSGPQTFAGSWLTVGDNGPAPAGLVLNNRDGVVVTIDNLTLNNGVVKSNGSGNVTLDTENLTVGPGGGTLDTVLPDRSIHIFQAPRGTGPLTIAGPGNVNLGSGTEHTGPLLVKGGTLSTNGTYGSLKVLQNPAYIDLFAGAELRLMTGGDVLADIHAMLAAGWRQEKKFSAGKLRSSTLAPGQTIAYDRYGTVRITLPGDSDLDGDVDFGDFVRLQSNYGKAPGFYDAIGFGDFDYNGVVDFSDFVLLQSSFGRSLTGARVAITREQYAAVTSITSNSQVPEPATLAVLGLSVAGLMRRRRA